MQLWCPSALVFARGECEQTGYVHLAAFNWQSMGYFVRYSNDNARKISYASLMPAIRSLARSAYRLSISASQTICKRLLLGVPTGAFYVR